LAFNRCLEECDYITTFDELEGDHDHEQIPDPPKIQLEKGERLFTFNMASYMMN